MGHNAKSPLRLCCVEGPEVNGSAAGDEQDGAEEIGELGGFVFLLKRPILSDGPICSNPMLKTTAAAATGQAAGLRNVERGVPGCALGVYGSRKDSPVPSKEENKKALRPNRSRSSLNGCKNDAKFVGATPAYGVYSHRGVAVQPLQCGDSQLGYKSKSFLISAKIYAILLLLTRRRGANKGAPSCVGPRVK